MLVVIFAAGMGDGGVYLTSTLARADGEGGLVFVRLGLKRQKHSVCAKSKS